jgi:hypothetical protein
MVWYVVEPLIVAVSAAYAWAAAKNPANTAPHANAADAAMAARTGRRAGLTCPDTEHSSRARDHPRDDQIGDHSRTAVMVGLNR